MKKILVVLLLLSLLIPSTAVLANSSAPGTWGSSINIQNPSTLEANVTLEFYDSLGTRILVFPVTPAIPAGGSRSLYVPTQIAGLTSGQYSVVASSDQTVNIVVNSSSTSPSTAGAYTGLGTSDSGTELFFPGLYNNYYGFASEIVIQNTGASLANISIQFYNQLTGAVVGSPYTHPIPVAASAVFTLSALSPSLPSGNAQGIFSAKITSNVAIGGIANNWSAYKSGEYSTYNGSTIAGQAAKTVVVPALYKNYYGFVSSLTIQNVDTTLATGTITYSNGKTAPFTLNPNQAKEFFQPNNPDLPSGNVSGVFSATITSDKLVLALVNVEDKVKGSLASYNGAINATTTVTCPVVLKDFYKWFSAETIQNVGSVATNVTVLYADGKTRTFSNIPPLGTVNVIELTEAGSVLSPTSSLAATFTSSAAPIVVVVQENSNLRYQEVAGDYLLAYNCTNK